MSDVRDSIPRSAMTLGQLRRIGALQAAKSLLLGGGYSGLQDQQVHQVLRLAEFIVKEEK